MGHRGRGKASECFLAVLESCMSVCSTGFEPFERVAAVWFWSTVRTPPLAPRCHPHIALAAQAALQWLS